MILDRILDTKRREVAERRAATPLATVQAQARAQTPARDFIAETLAADLGAAQNLEAVARKFGHEGRAHAFR